MAKKKIVITTDIDIYKKLKMLLYSDEVLFKSGNLSSVKRILKNINKDFKILELDEYDSYFTLKKINPANYDVYFRK